MTTWPRQPDTRSCGPSVVVVARALAAGDADDWADFGTRVAATHRALNRWWPRFLGTTPWAVARALGGRVRWIRGRGYADVLAALPQPTPVWTGTRLLPRHVVLALAARDGVPLVYNPAIGRLTEITESRWRTAWFAVVPVSVPPGRRSPA